MANNEMGYTVIPNKIKTDSNISYLSRFILGDIISFSNVSSCYASNKYFADMYQVSERRVEQCIKELCDNGYVHTVYNRKTRKRFTSPTPKCHANMKKYVVKEISEQELQDYQRSVLIKDLKKIWND